MYSVDDIAEIVAETGLSEALHEISPESIADPKLKELWDSAVSALDNINEFIEEAVASNFDDDDDDFIDDLDVDYGDDDEDDADSPWG